MFYDIANVIFFFIKLIIRLFTIIINYAIISLWLVRANPISYFKHYIQEYSDTTFFDVIL